MIANRYLSQLLLIVSYGVGSFASWKLCANHWYVGPIFGLVVIFWEVLSKNRRNVLRYIAFLILSTLIYACVFEIAGGTDSDWTKSVGGSFAVAIIFGSVLQPLNQVLVIGHKFKHGMLTSFALVLAYYGVAYSGGVLKTVGIDSMLILVFVWQGLYLLRFYFRTPVFRNLGAAGAV